jgi:hypothetical protein
MWRKPLFILIAILLAVDNIFIKFKISGISYDRLLELALFIYFFKDFLQEIRINLFFKKWVSFLLAFASLQLILNLFSAIDGGILFEDVYKGLFKCISFIAFSFLFLLIAKENHKYLNIIVFIHLMICVFAFLQHPFSPVASEMYGIKQLLYSSLEEGKGLTRLSREESYIEGGHGYRYRLSGPFGYSISFSYFAISSFILTFYMYLRYKKKFYIIILIVLFIASILSQTRSLILAEIVLVLCYLLFAKQRKSYRFKFLFIGATLIFSIYSLINTPEPTVGVNSRITNIDGDSRPLLWLTGFYTVMKHPLGVSDQEYAVARKEIFYIFGDQSILNTLPHHGVINIGFYYSFLGYLLFVLLVIFLLQYINLLESNFRLFFKLVLISYLIQVSFHNNIFLTNDYPFLTIIMLIPLHYYYGNDKNEILFNQTKKNI